MSDHCYLLSKIAKTRKGRKALKEKSPLLKENIKLQLVLRGKKASQVVKDVLQEFHWLRNLNSRKLSRKEMKRPFEDTTNFELLSKKFDASLFVYGSHSKKRPHNFVLGRMFDYQMLDMFELGINSRTLKTSLQIINSSYSIGTQPAILFCGELFDNDFDFKRLKNVFLDFLREKEFTILNLSELNRVIVLTTISEKTVFFRQYRIITENNENKVPIIKLNQIGPSIDFTLRKCFSASEELHILAREKIKQFKVSSRNIIQTTLGERAGRIHIQKQNLEKLNKIPSQKTKGFQKGKSKKKDKILDNHVSVTKRNKRMISFAEKYNKS